MLNWHDTNTIDRLAAANDEVSLDDFFAYMPMHRYIFQPSGELWPASSVNARVPPMARPDAKPIAASTWLDANAAVEQMTWAPGEPKLIRDKLIAEGGWLARAGTKVFNLYRPPTLLPKTASVEPWLELVRRLFDDEADHLVKWLAHRKQRPHDKINHALLIGGAQGIGKDTLLVPVKHAIGPWNFVEVSPTQLKGRFNGFLKSVICRISEARDLGEFDRYAFYEHLKAYTAAPPDTLRVDEKNIHEYYVPNLTGIIITTNYKTGGIYLPPDDRRHYVLWSELTKENFTDKYWTGLYRWYDNGGMAAVAAYLDTLDLSKFNAKAPPPQTPAFWEIVDASRAPEYTELADAIDALAPNEPRPNALTIEQVIAKASRGLIDFLADRKNARSIPHRLESCGYVRVRNDAAQDGMWKINGRRQVIYAKADLPVRGRIIAARQLDEELRRTRRS
jgi:hypothetical protein